jgi:uncharacterized protein YjiS (DUF1127 family)
MQPALALRPVPPRAPSIVARLLARIVAQDAAYREARALAEASPESLRDMGITR